MYLKLVIVGIGLLLFFRSVLFVVKRLSLQPVMLRVITLILQVAELLAWLGYLVWCIRQVFESESNAVLYGFGVAGALILIASWFLIREFIYGLSLVIQGKIETGVNITIEKLSGKVLRMGHFSFDILSDEGSIETVPYSKVRSEIISRPGQNFNLERKIISFSFPLHSNPEQVVEGLKKTLINAPWVAASQTPIIKNITTTGNAHIVEVVVYLPGKAFLEKVRAYVERNFIREINS